MPSVTVKTVWVTNAARTLEADDAAFFSYPLRRDATCSLSMIHSVI